MVGRNTGNGWSVQQITKDTNYLRKQWLIWNFENVFSNNFKSFKIKSNSFDKKCIFFTILLSFSLNHLDVSTYNVCFLLRSILRLSLSGPGTTVKRQTAITENHIFNLQITHKIITKIIENTILDCVTNRFV